MATTLKPNQLVVEKKNLFCPPIEDIAKVLNEGLKSNFEEISSSVVDCPNLKEMPFTLACEGLSGNPKIVEIGGPPYLLPLVKREKLYDLRDVPEMVEIDSSTPSISLLGAGAGPWPYAGVNCEMMVNLELNGKNVNNHSRIAKINKENNECILERLPNTESRTALLNNIFASNGLPGKVLKVHCKKRIGKQDFITSIRTILASHYKDKPIGLGGAFLIKKGKAKLHIMPEFSEKPIESDEGVNEWLKFFNMSSPLIAVGTLVTADPGLDLRLQHFHCYSHHGEGGHYHEDTEPKEAEYEGYFNIGENVYRIDRPLESHQFGRD